MSKPDIADLLQITGQQLRANKATMNALQWDLWVINRLKNLLKKESIGLFPKIPEQHMLENDVHFTDRFNDFAHTEQKRMQRITYIQKAIKHFEFNMDCFRTKDVENEPNS